MLRITFAAFALLSFVLSAQAQTPGEPGRFDYYVLALSWSPSWCAGKAGRDDIEQCGGLRRYGFVVHGLWPQYAKGGYPASCAVPAPLPPRLVEDVLPLMPSRRLVEHEWAKHGTCSGADAPGYFAQVKAARERVRIPPALDARTPVEFDVAEVERLFAAANPGLGPDAVAVTCKGNRAAEIRICMDKSLAFRDCDRSVRDTCRGAVRFPAAR